MGYTIFAKEVRKLMIDNDENMVDLSKILKVSTPFISLVFTGKKSAPENWIDILSNHYELDKSKKDLLIEAYNLSKDNIKIDLSNVSLERKKLAFTLCRDLSKINDESVNEILLILRKEKE